MIKKFKEIDLPLESLLLDPNNPRFSKAKDEETPEKNFTDTDIQKYAYNEMLKSSNNFEIEELADSIKTKGFYPVDKIFVKKIKDKYLVIEGNRRVTAIKYLLEKNKSKTNKHELNKSIVDSFKKIKCVDLTENTEDDINLILGLRHHGSIKEWKIWPASFNLFNRYMKEYSKEYKIKETDIDSFVIDKKILERVGDLFSIKTGVVKDGVQAYRVYVQLHNSNANLDDNKFSMIIETLKNRVLKRRFEFDPNKCIFSSDGLEAFVRLCIGFNHNKSVITSASVGSSNLRDYAYVVATGQENYIKMIEDGGKPAEDVKAMVKDKETERDLINTLKKILSEVNKIKIGDFKSQKLAPEEKLVIKNIGEKWLKFKKAAGEK